MYLLSHITQSIKWKLAGKNITTDISEQIHIVNVNQVY